MHAAECLRTIVTSRAVRPFNLAGGQALLNSKKSLNTFAAELSPILRRYFSSTTDNREPEIYGRAYVTTDETTEYDKVLDLYYEIALRFELNPMVQVLEPTRHAEPNLAKAITAMTLIVHEKGNFSLLPVE